MFTHAFLLVYLACATNIFQIPSLFSVILQSLHKIHGGPTMRLLDTKNVLTWLRSITEQNAYKKGLVVSFKNAKANFEIKKSIFYVW